MRAYRAVGGQAILHVAQLNDCRGCTAQALSTRRWSRLAAPPVFQPQSTRTARFPVQIFGRIRAFRKGQGRKPCEE
jgi:hypothetical protein